jgi:hypothetical protein
MILKLDCESELIIDKKPPTGDTRSPTYNRMPTPADIQQNAMVHGGSQIITDRRCTRGRFM